MPIFTWASMILMKVVGTFFLVKSFTKSLKFLESLALGYQGDLHLQLPR